MSSSMGDSGAAMQRAHDKIATMQARAGAMDELLASGALTDLNQPVDDIQDQLNKISSTSQVDNELAAMRAELAASSPAGILESSTGDGAADDGDAADDDASASDAEIVDAAPAAASPAGGPPATDVDDSAAPAAPAGDATDATGGGGTTGAAAPA
jgi:phage shock protein A